MVQKILDIHIVDKQQSLSLSLSGVKILVKAVIVLEGRRCDEVSVHFVETAEICHLHGEFFGDPSPTDCISFPMDEDEDDIGMCVLGDVFVCTSTAVEYAKEHKCDPYQETALYIVHGLLHLMGYDDMNDEDRLEMRSAEERHMKNLALLNVSLKG